MHAKARSHHASSKPTWHRDGAGPEAAAARPVSVALALGTGSRAAPGATTHATSLIKAACSQPVTRPSHWRCIARHFCVKMIGADYSPCRRSPRPSPAPRTVASQTIGHGDRRWLESQVGFGSGEAAVARKAPQSHACLATQA